MSELDFSDSISIDTSGELRLLHLFDGCYVVGLHCLIPVNDDEEGYSVIKSLSLEEKEK